MRSIFFQLTTALLLVQPAGLHADWPEFRGPTGQGHAESTQAPVHWSTTENVVWKSTVPGVGWSSPVIQNDRIYLTTALLNDSGEPESLAVLAFDFLTGKQLWKRKVFEPGGRQRKHQKNSHASPTPIVEGGRLYAHFGHMGTACLNLEGEILWRQTDLEYQPVHGNGGSPVLYQDKLIFSCDGGSDPFLVALNKHTGKVVWRVDRETDARSKFSFSTPLVIQVDGEPQLISPGSGMVGAYHPDDGSLLWQVRYGEGYSVIPRPVHAHGMLFIGTGYDRPVVYGIRTGGQGDVTDTHVAWTTRRQAPNTPSMLAAGDELYFVSDGGIASCVDARTGKLHWNERLEGDFSASPIMINGRIYFISESGVTTVIEAGTEFKRTAVNDLEERTLASPAVYESSIVMRTMSHLYRIQKAVP